MPVDNLLKHPADPEGSTPAAPPKVHQLVWCIFISTNAQYNQGMKATPEQHEGLSTTVGEVSAFLWDRWVQLGDWASRTTVLPQIKIGIPPEYSSLPPED